MITTRIHLVLMVEVRGVEPLASCLQSTRSSQLSYTPVQP